jgi:hypothetical protein
MTEQPDFFTPEMFTISQGAQNIALMAVIATVVAATVTALSGVLVALLTAHNQRRLARGVRALVQDAINRPFYSKWVTIDLTPKE